MFKNISKSIIISISLGTAYLIYLIITYSTIDINEEDAPAFLIIFMTLSLPHLYLTGFACLIGLVAIITKKPALALISALSFFGAAIIFPLYAIFLLPSILFGFIGYRNQKRLVISE
jgi:hypothetical protein